MIDPQPEERGIDLAPPALLDRIRRKGRTIEIATDGSDELRYLNAMNAHANVGGETLRHILLKEDPRRIEVMEEFLHGTQYKCHLIGRPEHDQNDAEVAEVLVKRFMIRHHRLLGIAEGDVRVLERMVAVVRGRMTPESLERLRRRRRDVG